MGRGGKGREFNRRGLEWRELKSLSLFQARCANARPRRCLCARSN